LHLQDYFCVPINALKFAGVSGLIALFENAFLDWLPLAG
jgi:hypothetical protein